MRWAQKFAPLYFVTLWLLEAQVHFFETNAQISSIQREENRGRLKIETTANDICLWESLEGAVLCSKLRAGCKFDTCLKKQSIRAQSIRCLISAKLIIWCSKALLGSSLKRRKANQSQVLVIHFGNLCFEVKALLPQVDWHAAQKSLVKHTSKQVSLSFM